MPLSKQQSQDDTANAIKQDVSKILGNSGTEHFSGYFTEEPNTDWRDELRVQNVEKMRRTDATVKAVLNALKAPILATTWDIECEDEKIEEFIEENIFNLKRSWLRFLRESLTFLDFGFSVFELIYEIRGGKIYLVDLSPRIQHSIQKWRLDDGSKGVVQRIRNDEKADETTKGINFGTVEIPMEKLFVLTNDMEGDDITGQSVLRPAWKHYTYKEILYKIQGIAAERYGVGVPVVTMSENYGEGDKDKAEEAAKNLRSNESSYVVLPAGFDMKILTPTGNPQGAAIDSGINHHNKMILMSVLATFLGLGTDSTGSFALSKDQSSFFLKHVEDKAKYLAEEFTEQVIKRLVRYNFGDQAEVPRLVFAPLGDLDFQEMSGVMKTLVDSGLVQVDGKMMQYTRDMFKLPEMSDDDVLEKDMEDQLSGMEADVGNDEFSFADVEEEPMPDMSTDGEDMDPEDMQKPKDKKMEKEMPPKK